MQVPRDDEEDRSRGKIPSPGRRVKEGKKAIWYGQKELTRCVRCLWLYINVVATEMLTSIKISLCSNTPRRMLAKVIPIIIIKAPIIKPCDQASRVSFAGLAGQAPGTDIVTQQDGAYMNKRVILWGVLKDKKRVETEQY